MLLLSQDTTSYSKSFSDQLIPIAMSCADYFPLPTSFGEAVQSLLWFIKGLICLFRAGLAAVCIVSSVADSESFCFIWVDDPSLKRNHQKLGLSEHVPQKSDDSFISSIFKWEFGVPPKTDSFLPVFCPHSLSPDFGCEGISNQKMVPAIFFQQTFVVLSFSFIVHPRWWHFFKATSASNLESLGISYGCVWK